MNEDDATADSDPNLHETIEQTFLDLVDLPQMERDRKLEKLAGGSKEIYDSVAAMLECDRTQDPLFDQNPRLSEVPAWGRLKPKDVIDSYEILGLLGEGGMGVVYRARKRGPVETDVAIKVVNSGFDSQGIVSRFEAERKVLALFDHPNLTRIFDGGTTDNGQPYFVMEYVPGKPVTSFCKDNSVGLNERLEMLAQICDAIHHAHQKGVIHRDVKPSNILVTKIDEKPVPKVIDFGTAKSLDRTAFHSGLTLAGDIIGTPLYMSPEQAESGAASVDVRSDVYSLGVVLYELLTGSTPLQLSDIEDLSSIKMLEAIRDYSIELPSVRAEKTDGLSELLGYEIQKSSLARHLRGDLNLIVSKALAKDINLRYGSIADLRSDIVSYLNGDPVSAAAPSLTYHASKFVRKYPRSIAITAIMSFGILIFTVITIKQGIENRKSLEANQELVVQLKLRTQELEETIRRADSAESSQRETNNAKKYAIVLERAALSCFDFQSPDYLYKANQREDSQKNDGQRDDDPTELSAAEPLRNDTGANTEPTPDQPEEVSMNFLDESPVASTFYGQELAMGSLGLRCLLPGVMKRQDFLPLITPRRDDVSSNQAKPTETTAGKFCLVLIREMNLAFVLPNDYKGIVYCALAQSQLECDNFKGALESIETSIRVFRSTSNIEFELFASLIKCSVLSQSGQSERSRALKTDIGERVRRATRSQRIELLEKFLERGMPTFNVVESQ